MDYVPTSTKDAFHSDLHLAQITARAAVSSQRAVGQDKTWTLWCDYCAKHNVDPLLESVPDPIPPTSWSSDTESEMEGLQKVVNWSGIELWRTPSVPWARQWPAWGPMTNDSCPPNN
jgi:hypothetical protein